MKIKVCGMREAANIKALIKLDIAFIGFIFHEKSARNVSKKPTVNIPKNIQKVGVFVNKSKKFIQEKAREFDLDIIQLHGQESPEFCQEIKALGLEVIKAFNIKTDFDFTALKNYEKHCDYFVFDAYGKQAGGNGIVFNWDLLKNYQGETPFLLSGGLKPTLIAEIKEFKHKKCIGLDINSGFEIAAAQKDIPAIATFIQNIKQ